MNRILRVALCLALICTAAFWLEHSRYRARQLELGRLMSQRVLPFQLAGLYLPLPDLLRIDGEGDFSRDARRRLIIAVSDACPFCHGAQPTLCGLTTSAALTIADEVVVVSMEGMTLAAELAACGREGPARVIVAQPDNRTDFITSTSMGATPAVVLMDDGWRIRESFVNGQFDQIEIALRSVNP